MATKEKIIEALNCTLEDISEERLLDLLLDAYQAKLRRIRELEAENAVEREALHRDREEARESYHRMRTDPLYATAGEYFFRQGGKRFRVQIRGYKIALFETANGANCVDIMAQQVSPNEYWERG